MRGVRERERGVCANRNKVEFESHLCSIVPVREISQHSFFTNSNNYVAVLERKGIRMRDIATHGGVHFSCVKPF